MATGRDLVNKLMTQRGKSYIFGYEVNLKDSNPKAYDCSEIIEWGLFQLGIKFPDGSLAQINACQKISVAQAIATPGALLWRPGHIAVSRGDGTTIEAKGKNYGVGVFSAHGRFTRGGLIIPLSYANKPTPPPVIAVDYPAIRRFAAADLLQYAQALPNLNKSSPKSLHIIVLQKVFNFLANAKLKEDGVYGPATITAVTNFQKLLSIKGDPVGSAHEVTRWIFCIALANIRDGKA